MMFFSKRLICFFGIFFFISLSAWAAEVSTVKLMPQKSVTLDTTSITVTLTKLSVDFIDVETADGSSGYMLERIWGELLFRKGKESKKVPFNDKPFSFTIFDTNFELTAVTRNWVELKREPDQNTNP